MLRTTFMVDPLRRLPAQDGRFAPALTAAIRSYIERLGSLVSWQRLARVPGDPLAAGPIRRLTDRVRLSMAGPRAFLRPSSRQVAELARLTREAPRSAAVFRLACNCEPTPMAIAAELLGEDLLARTLDAGVLYREGESIRAAITLAPFCDRVYVADARGHAGPGDHPVYLGETTAQEVEYCRRWLPCGRRRRAYEIGTGTGLVAIELRDRYEHWDGGEFDPRAVAFSRLNAELHGAANVRFFQSDLFSGASGRYDLVLFNPWQPSEDSVELIERFLREAPEFLEPDGHLVLLIESGEIAGRNVILDRIAAALATAGMSAERSIRGAYGRGGDPPTLGVTSVLWIRLDPSRAGAIRTRTDLRAVRVALRAGILRIAGR